MTDEEDSRNEVEKRQKHRTDSSPMKENRGSKVGISSANVD